PTGGEIGLPIGAIGSGATNRIMQHSIVGGIGDVEAGIIRRDALWQIEAFGAQAAVLDASAGERRLPVDAIGGGAAGRIVEHPVVEHIRDIKAARGVESDAMGKVQASGAVMRAASGVS